MLGSLIRDVCRRLGGAPRAPGAEEIRALLDAGDAGTAERRLREGLSRRPRDAESMQLLGLVLLQTGRHGEAVEMLSRAVAAAPEAAFYRANLAQAWRAAGELSKAVAQARRARELEPASAPMRLNLANVLAAAGRPDEALVAAQEAAALAPEDGAAWLACADLHVAAGRSAAAVACFGKALAADPGMPRAAIGLYATRAAECDWTEYESDVQRVRAELRRWAAAPGPGFEEVNPFTAYRVPLEREVRLAVSRRYAAAVAGSAPAPVPRAPATASTAAGRIRLGYLSADFHRHPTMHLCRRLFALHDRARYEVTLYSCGPDDGSEYRRKAVQDADRFVDIRGDSDAAAAARIRSEGIDVLVDLKGYTLDARPAVFALRPAPVQAAWLGYPAPCCAPFIDYTIADRTVVPPGDERWFGEKLAYMPHTYQVTDDAQPIAAQAAARAAAGLPESAFVYCCFNNSYKITPDVFAAWMRILLRTEGSVLWLFRSNEAAERNLRRAADRAGVPAARLVFCDPVAKPEHLARLALADLCLDTGMINAHTGASDALWAGVPLLTWPGEEFPARVASSVLRAAGLEELVCRDLKEYEERAVACAGAPDALAALRARVGLARSRSPLFDTPRFVRALERAYEHMLARARRGLPPESFDVPDGD